MNVASYVERGRRDHPARAAVTFEGTTLDYGSLDAKAGAVAASLRRMGIGRGDRIALWLPNVAGWAIAYLAIQKLGAIAVSMNPALKPDEARFILGDSGATTVVTTETLEPQLDASVRRILTDGGAGAATTLDELAADGEYVASLELEPSDPSAIVYTSGTTGFPKGAVLSHANVCFTVEAKRRYMGVRPDDRLLLFLPLFHCFGQNAVFNAAMGAGATIVLHRSFDPERVIRSMAEGEASMFFGVPTTYLMLLGLARPEDLAGVRYFFSAAAPLPVDVERRWAERFGHTIFQGYGLTETSPFASYNHETRHVPGSIGAPIEGVEMRVVDVDSGEETAPGETGEIVVRGPNVMLGYWNRPEETRAAIRDGWFHTGDIGRVDADGYFFVEDRLKDMVNVGGLKVYPAEVENVIHTHPAVVDVAVFGAADPLMGERVVAHVVLAPGSSATDDDIVAFCGEKLAKYKVPRDVRFVDSIPKSPTGKILKRILRDLEAERV